MSRLLYACVVLAVLGCTPMPARVTETDRQAFFASRTDAAGCLPYRRVLDDLGLPTAFHAFPDGSQVVEWDQRRTSGALLLPGLPGPLLLPTLAVPVQSGQLIRLWFDPTGCLQIR